MVRRRDVLQPFWCRSQRAAVRDAGFAIESQNSLSKPMRMAISSGSLLALRRNSHSPGDRSRPSSTTEMSAHGPSGPKRTRQGRRAMCAIGGRSGRVRNACLGPPMTRLDINRTPTAVPKTVAAPSKVYNSPACRSWTYEAARTSRCARRRGSRVAAGGAAPTARRDPADGVLIGGSRRPSRRSSPFAAFLDRFPSWARPTAATCGSTSAAARECRSRKASAAEFVRSAPDVVVVAGDPSLAELQPLTTTIPIVSPRLPTRSAAVFAGIARPRGDIAGFGP